MKPRTGWQTSKQLSDKSPVPLAIFGGLDDSSAIQKSAQGEGVAHSQRRGKGRSACCVATTYGLHYTVDANGDADGVDVVLHNGIVYQRRKCLLHNIRRYWKVEIRETKPDRS